MWGEQVSCKVLQDVMHRCCYSSSEFPSSSVAMLLTEDLFCPFSEAISGRDGDFQSVFSGYYWSGYHPLGNFIALNNVDDLNVSSYLAVKQ